MKVTDKRMFTDDGELREEYRFLEQQKGGAGTAEASRREPPAPANAAPKAAARDARPGAAPRHEPPLGDPQAAGPGFLDLVAVLAEPIPFLLGDAKLPDGKEAKDLARARLSIDLLAVLQDKTRGNVTAEETAILENLVAQLRMRYVQQAGA